MTDYTEEQKAKRRELEEHERWLQERANAERAAYLATGNRHARRRLKALTNTPHVEDDPS
jgi:hypothetical protein